VRQAAHQSTAETRDFGWVQAEALPFRHPDRDRVESVHEGGAAQTSPTWSKTAAHPCTVTNTKRSHLDPSSVSASEFAQQGSEIEPSLGGEVDHCPAAGQGETGFDGPHVEIDLACPPAKKGLDLALDVMGVLTPFLVLGRRQSNDPAQGSRSFPEDRQGEEAHAPEKLSVRCLDEIIRVVPNLEGSSAAGD